MVYVKIELSKNHFNHSTKKEMYLHDTTQTALFGRSF